jgi:D-sedoheptulose 7-phosphate isomerase
MTQLIQNYVSNFKQSLESLDFNKIDKISELVILKSSNQNTIYIIGNGGSAALAEHMSTDMMFGTKASHPTIATICLSSNSSSLTATGNDINFESIFSRQLRNIGKKGDLLIVISASGNSINLINAVNEAKKLQMDTLGILGFDGGMLINLVDHFIHVKTAIGEYGISEDLHLMINHLIVESIKEKVNK